MAQMIKFTVQALKTIIKTIPYVQETGGKSEYIKQA